MAKSMSSLLSITLLVLFAFAPVLCFSWPKSGHGIGHGGGRGGGSRGGLFPHYYYRSCPRAEEIVRSVVAKAVAKERRMGASLLRLTFHDCFVQGCDASLLLDDGGSIRSEKNSNPNKNSARGFDVIDNIKAALEKECPMTVSCADVLQLAARDSVVLAGGPHWEVPLGRKDSTTASISQSNNNIPAPNNTFSTILAKFQRQGLNLADLVALSGSHTIGNARCTSFKQRLYNQNHDGKPDATLEKSYTNQLRSRCPRSGGDNNLFVLDKSTPAHFDTYYYNNLISGTGLLNSDQVLYTKNKQSKNIVDNYAGNQKLFFQHFVNSMVKMGNIKPLTGNKGEIRKNCRRVNNH